MSISLLATVPNLSLRPTGEWNDVHCSARLPSVCEQDPANTGPIGTTVFPHIDGFCPTGENVHIFVKINVPFHVE